jgi:peptidoglycan-N-acetylglucosamine deacetylase
MHKTILKPIEKYTLMDLKKIRTVIVILMLSVLSVSSCPYAVFAQEKSSVCFTFDDGNPKDILDYTNDQWNQMILDQLKEYKLQAILYVCGKNVDNEKGKHILESWDNAGHIIANHTYTHLNYNSKEMNYERYKDDILHCDSLIHGYTRYQKYFRAPFLKYGETIAKRDSLQAFLKRIQYKNGYVTIDASDWFYNSRLLRFMEKNPGKSIHEYRKVYIDHLMERAKFYDQIAYQLLGRKIKHSILLHHNLTSALFLGDLIKAFHQEGWETINAEDALSDEVYQKVPDIVPAGESLIWGLAKESGKYDALLRYPGEDSSYEEEKLNSLGL